MKRVIAFICVLCLTATAASAETGSTQPMSFVDISENLVVQYDNVYVDEGNLCSDTPVYLPVTTAPVVEILDNTMIITSEVNAQEIVVITGSVADNKIISASITSDNYAVLAVVVYARKLQAVLYSEDENRIVMLECYDVPIETLDLVSFNDTWYSTFVYADVEEYISDAQTMSHTQHTKTYTRTVTILNYQCRETLILGFDYEWNNPVSAGGYGEFTCAMGIHDKSSVWTNTSTQEVEYYENSSLEVHDMMLHTATDAGQYLYRIEWEEYVQDSPSGTYMKVGMSYAIPNTNFSVNAEVGTYQFHDYDNGGYTFTSRIGQEVTRATVSWNDRYTVLSSLDNGTDHTEDSEYLGEKVIARVYTKTAEQYNTNTSHELGVKWEFSVSSTGADPERGTAVPGYSTSGYFNNHLSYTVNSTY